MSAKDAAGPGRPAVRRRMPLAAVVLASALLSACASAPAEPPVPPGTAAPEGYEELALPPIEAETLEWMDRLQAAVGGDPAFGTIAIDETRRVVTVTWFGDPSATLTDHVEQAPGTIDVVIHPADFPPAELRDLVTRAMRPDFAVPGVEVVMGGMKNDGSGITVGIAELPAGMTLDELGAAIADALGRPDVPVEVEVTGEIMPITG